MSFPRLYLWINSNNRKNFLEKQRQKIISAGSTENYFDNMDSDKVYNYMTPILIIPFILKKKYLVFSIKILQVKRIHCHIL